MYYFLEWLLTFSSRKNEISRESPLELASLSSSILILHLVSSSFSSTFSCSVCFNKLLHVANGYNYTKITNLSPSFTKTDGTLFNEHCVDLGSSLMYEFSCTFQNYDNNGKQNSYNVHYFNLFDAFSLVHISWFTYINIFLRKSLLFNTITETHNYWIQTCGKDLVYSLM